MSRRKRSPSLVIVGALLLIGARILVGAGLGLLVRLPHSLARRLGSRKQPLQLLLGVGGIQIQVDVHSLDRSRRGRGGRRGVEFAVDELDQVMLVDARRVVEALALSTNSQKSAP